MVQETGVVPNALTEQQLRKLVLDAMNASSYSETLETYTPCTVTRIVELRMVT
jgi:hypothetical protein